VDLDGDGNRDILSGSYSRFERPMAGLFQVLSGRADGTFKEAEVLKGSSGKPLTISVLGEPDQGGLGETEVKNICTRPFAIDWDGDRNIDLVVGNFIGTFYVFYGEGKGRFAPAPEEIKSQGKPLTVKGHHGDPFVIDWDGDGDLDLLSGASEGGVQWAENLAGPGKVPRLQVFQTLIEPGPQYEWGNILREADVKGPLSNTRIWVDDFNADGKLDIFVGDLVNLVSPADNLTEKQFKEKFATWSKALEEVSMIKNTEKEVKNKQQAAAKRSQELYNQRSEFMKDDSTGFVWLYLQK
jgi:hypothetical protein